MKIIKVQNYLEMSKVAFEIVKKVVKTKPNAVLGLATGSTPLEMYRLMVNDCKQGNTTYSNVITFNLDEYVGLDGTHEQSYQYYMKHNLFCGIDIDINNTHIPCGKAIDLTLECEKYHNLLLNNVRDLQILGIGSNGHIGFNEPFTPFDSATHVVELSQSTIKDNSRLFESIESVPKKAITMGLSEITNAKQILVLASGVNKAQAVKAMINGAVDISCPASILQQHDNVTVIGDIDALSLL